MTPCEAPPRTKSERPSLRAKVIQLIEDDPSLPSFPAIVQQVNNMLARSDVNLPEVAELAKLDPALSGRLLRLANSAAYGGRERITCLTAAIMRLGVWNVRKMTTTTGVINAAQQLGLTMDWEAFWKHSLLTARLTERLMKAYTLTSGMEYLAGLLHRIGVLFVQHYFPQEFSSMVVRVKHTGLPWTKIEKDTLDITHPRIGALVCKRWDLDTPIIDAVGCYDNPRSLPPMTEDRVRILTLCLSIAAHLSRLYVNHALSDGILHESDLEKLPQWQQLQDYPAHREIELNLDAEAAEVEQIFFCLTL